jgi:hypothetical protein
LKAGDIAENPGPVNGSQNIRNIVSFRLVLALLFVYSVKVGENEGKCCVLFKNLFTERTGSLIDMKISSLK